MPLFIYNPAISVVLSTLPFKAFCVAVDIGLSKSEVLSTLLKPTYDLVTWCGLFLLEM
jgi:hypothetical protein